MPTRWLGKATHLPLGKVSCGADPEVREPSLRPCLALGTESTPVLYIASSDGLVEIQFHIFNYQFSWGGEESSPHPFLAGCWTPIAAWALPCTIYPFGLVALPPPGKGQVQGPGALLSPCTSMPICTAAQVPPTVGKGHTGRGGGTSPCIYLKSYDVIY